MSESEAGAPIASVIIPCRNGAAVLGGMLSSLVDDALSADIEIVVADNGSTDDSRAVAESFVGKLPGIRVIDASARRGRTEACNAGAAVARGDVLLFLDADDEVQPGYVSAMVRALQDADLAGGALDVEKLNPPWVAETRQPGLGEDGLSHYMNFLPIVGGSIMGVRREVFQAVGGFDVVPFAEDVDFSWRVQLAGFTVVGVPDAVVSYRYRDDLWGIFRQALDYGVSQPLLYRRYAKAGFRRIGPLGVVISITRLTKQGFRARNRAQVGAWLFLLGLFLGRVRGSVRHRTLYL